MPIELYPNDSRTKVFTLAHSGEVQLFGPEIDVIDTPEFQRLAGLRQLGTSNLVFRTAVHTRFEHSLGTLHMVEVILGAARSSVELLSEEEQRDARRLARLGGLLHDLPHVPFGHTLEDEFQLLPRHDEDPARWALLLEQGELGELLTDALGVELYGELKRLLQAKTELDVASLRFPFVADIVGNTVCADLLDYVVRDLKGCGMDVALGRRFLSYFTITTRRLGVDGDIDSRRMALRLEKRGMPRPDVASEVVKLLTARYDLAERVYFHHAKNAASVMIGRAVQDLGLVGPPPADGQVDQRALDFVFLPDGTALSDDLLLHAIATPAAAAALGLPATGDEAARARASRLGQDLLRRRLYKVAYLGVHDDLAHRVNDIGRRYGTPAARRRLEDRLAAELGLEPGDVLLHLPRAEMMSKAAKVRVEREDGSVLTLEGWDRSHSKRIDALNDAHARLWRVLVYVRADTDPNMTEKRRLLVGAAAADVFGAPSRYIPGVSPALPEGWLESAAIRTGLSHLHAHIAREIAVDRGLSAADVEAAMPEATQKVAGYGAAPTLVQVTAAWQALLPDAALQPALTEPAQLVLEDAPASAPPSAPPAP